MDDTAPTTIPTTSRCFRSLRAQKNRSWSRPLGRHGPVQAQILRRRHAASHPLLHCSKRILLHLRPVPTIGPRILTRSLRTIIRRDQHGLHYSITPRPTTHPAMGLPPLELRLWFASSGSSLDNVHSSFIWDYPHAEGAGHPSLSLRPRRLICPLATPMLHSIWTSTPRR